MNGPVDRAHALPAAEVLQRLGVSAGAGLAGTEVERRLQRHGRNELATVPPVPLWRRAGRHLREPVILLLLVAAAVSLALGEAIDAAAIATIVLLNAGLALFQEQRAARALEALRAMIRPTAQVIRDGSRSVVAAAELVVGDVILLQAGDIAPADARLVATTAFRTQEAALTGESLPVDKDAELVLPSATPLAERRNLVFCGTVAAAGQACAVVVATGMATEFGRIAAMLRSLTPKATPMQRQLARLGMQLAVLCVAIALVLAGWYLLQGEPPAQVLVRSISLAVAAVPEGLPAVVTIALALGMRRLVRANALMRRMHAVESLGAVGVICTDKTGTLTRNEMQLRHIGTASSSFTLVPAAGAAAARWIDADGTDAPVDDDELRQLLTIATRCNDAQLRPSGEAQAPWQVVGDPTEGALLVAAAELRLPAPHDERRIFAVPFDSARKRMSVAVADGAGSTAYVKGATEALLPCCTREYRGGRVQALDAAARARILATVAELCRRGLRVLALAYRPGPATPDDIETDLVFAGIAGMRDPPREQVPAAIRACHAAGIRPVMITGDHPETALAIAREIGLAAAEDGVVTGAELHGWSDAELAARLPRCAVFARTTAEDKLRLVRAFQADGQVVAMTGDGVNDAPALGEADIGIAMGRSGTDVTREAADLVLLDDDFATIVAAVREGRGIFDNIQKFVHYLLTANASEILFVAGAAAIGWPPPLTALQLLWINLITDGLPALALGMEPVDPDVLARPPRPRLQGVLTAGDAGRILVRGSLIAAVTAAAFYIGSRQDLGHARSLALATLVTAQLGLAFGFRSRSRTLLQLGPASNLPLLLCVGLALALQIVQFSLPGLRAVFQLQPLTFAEAALAAAAGLVPVTIVELGKLRRP